ncbi:MAG: response regulator [Archangium sp.]|nr:response regulator [Archangium sp.]
MARQIVDAHGGEISVKSNPGKGSVFTVKLPLLRGRKPSRPLPEIAPPSPVTAQVPSKERRVLLVEDDEDIRAAVSELLMSEGYDVVMARNGQEGLQRLQSLTKPPNVIVLDLLMPVLDGVGFAAEQQKKPEWSEIPVVVLSGNGSGGHPRAQIPRAVFLQKPVDVDDLLRLIDQICSRSTPGRQPQPTATTTQ